MKRLLFCLFLLIANNSYASSASDFIQDLGDNTLSIITNSTLSNDDKESSLKALCEKSIDTDWIGRFVLGRNWKVATTEQQQQFLVVYKKYLINNYVPYFKNYAGEKFKIFSENKINADEYIIQTLIIHPDGQTNRINYRVAQSSSGSFTIHDVIIEGVSLITTGRSDFSSIISNSSIDGLIEKLKSKVE